MFTPIRILLNAQRHNKRIITLIYDILAIFASLLAAHALRLDTLTFDIGSRELLSMITTAVVTIVCFVKLGMYRAVLRYMM